MYHLHNLSHMHPVRLLIALKAPFSSYSLYEKEKMSELTESLDSGAKNETVQTTY